MSWEVVTNVWSAFLGWLAAVRVPTALRLPLLRWFAGRYKLDLSEAAAPLESFESIAALFTRTLRPGARPIGTGIVSPVDGRLRSVSTISSDSLEQIKGVNYRIADLVGNQALASSLQGGVLLNLYLAPHNYHRVHAPLDIKIKALRHIRGALFPVNDYALHNVAGLFARNERLVIEFSSEGGSGVFIMVGAFSVGSMSVSFDIIRTDSGCNSYRNYQDLALSRGSELGVFHLGSSVVVLLDANLAAKYPKWLVGGGSVVKMGQTLLS
jgi:phosphatidylserine decarboxylase